MGESAVADFIGRFHVSTLATDEPVSGRVVLSQRRLVLAAEDGKTTVPLSAVFDVAVGSVPPELQEFFNDTVTVAYDRGGGREVAVIEGNGENVDRFRTVLFKALLHRTTVLVQHPARVGGRVVSSNAERARVKLSQGSLRFVQCSDPFEVDLSMVTHVERDERTLGGQTVPVISFKHVVDGQTTTSFVGVNDSRELNILGRYIRLEYQSVMEELSDVNPTTEEMESLVAIYSAGEGVHLSDLTNVSPAQLTMVLNSLAEDGLVVDGEDATRLTPKGQALVSRRLEQVNT